MVAVLPESSPDDVIVIADAISNPPTDVMPGTFAVASTNVTEVVLAPLEPVTANLLASVVTAKLAKVTGKVPTFVKNEASLTLLPIVVPVVFCIGPVVIGPEKFVLPIVFPYKVADHVVFIGVC